MKRYAAYDPPEYVEWEPDEGLVEAYRARLRENPGRSGALEELDTGDRLDLYRGLLRFRLHDIMLQRWVKQGVISKAWLGTGEEAVTIGAVHALRREGRDGDYVGPMIRNNGACHEMGMPIADMLRAYLATGDSPTHGRDLHVGDLDHGVVTPISMVGGLAPVMNGFALAFKRRGESRVTLTWVGDGATKHGEVHEALNFAAVMRLPAIVVIQNNQVALGTRLGQHHLAADFSEWGRAYGASLERVDGNNVLDVYAAVRRARERCLEGRGPVFLEAETFRMGGHATHDVREARETFPAELFESWGKRDPIGLYEEVLARGARELAEAGFDVAGDDRETRNRAVLAAIEAEVDAEVEAAAEEALESRRERMPAPADAGSGVYA
ncbi:MAG TPA: thiamine pyrophosphate-dependent dehydrogenase E1 component subunit alpha [Gemmatimonadota bacterium]|nr:thiamine pyrophosphate-dependent dehydrogenase E1 component subunit alpha [Gemmatimonadota bacterium]